MDTKKTTEVMRFGFGANWKSYLAKHLSDERIALAKEQLLGFLGREDLVGMRVLDIGSGSGIHSLAAHLSGAREVVSFDYDPDSVEATRSLHQTLGAPENWMVRQGSVLDADFMATLGTFDLVYSWGVLHHTGDVLAALGLAAERVASDGIFFIALYDSDWSVEAPEFWYDIKQKYNRAGWLKKRILEAWYVLCFEMNCNPLRIPVQIKKIINYKKSRGMDYYHDVKDWLGGWPMQYIRLYEVIPRMQQKGLTLLRSKLGEANTEYLFSGVGSGRWVTQYKPISLPTPLLWDVVTLRNDKEFRKLSIAEPIYVYGAGVGGSLVKAELERLGFSVCGFISTDKGGEYEGLPVYPVGELKKVQSGPSQIIIASSFFDSISYSLVNHGYQHFFNAFPYIMGKLK